MEEETQEFIKISTWKEALIIASTFLIAGFLILKNAPRPKEYQHEFQQSDIVCRVTNGDKLQVTGVRIYNSGYLVRSPNGNGIHGIFRS